jgi:hypothetical protein
MVNGISPTSDPLYMADLKIAEQGAYNQIGQDNDYHAEQKEYRDELAAQS